jgi:hypothetical protein
MNRASSVPVSLKTTETVSHFLSASTASFSNSSSFVQSVNTLPAIRPATRSEQSQDERLYAELNILLIPQFFTLHLVTRRCLAIQLNKRTAPTRVRLN